MADASALSEQHRRAQGQVRARTLRDFLAVAPIWQGDWASFQQLMAAVLPLVRAHRATSTAVAASYYQAARTAENVTGAGTPRLAAPVNPAAVAKSLYVTGQAMTRDALQAGQSPEQARRTALVRVSGAVTRHVLDGGRDTILRSVEADRQALGWARVTDGDPCAFCLVLASRGPVYKTEETAGFAAHDHDQCVAAPVFRRDTVIPNLDRWRAIYDAAQRDGVESGQLQPGENSSNARINAVRRYLAANR